MHRPTLGIAAGLIFLAGVVVSFVPGVGGQDHLFWGGVMLRMGAVLGALWLVLPSARKMSWRVWTGIAVLVGTIAFRPRLVLYAFGISVAIMLYELIARARSREGRAGQPGR